MKDFGRSDDPRVQAQLDRLATLTVPQGRLGLETIRGLLDRLGNPQRDLPPVFHVAGTNGKGSTCAFLRAMMEAQGLRVHTATKPHLVRYNERIRLSGQLIDDELLATLLCEVLDKGEDLAPSFFEVTTAATFLAFARIPADACIIEVGLGGRFDATNVIETPAVCGIAALGIDHEAFLLAPEEGTPDEPIARIAFEKAGIAKAHSPLVTMAYPEAAAEQIRATAARMGAPLYMCGRNWFADIEEIEEAREAILYRDAQGDITLPLPTLSGEHQAENAALAVAMIRHQNAVEIGMDAMAEGIRAARWPARLQLLGDGPLTALAPDRPIWLDGGHNANAGGAIADHFVDHFDDRGQVHIIIAMLANRDPAAFLVPLANMSASITAVPIAGSACHEASAYGEGATWAGSVTDALTALPDDGRPVLITGSLYLAGEVLRLNDEVPE